MEEWLVTRPIAFLRTELTRRGIRCLLPPGCAGRIELPMLNPTPYTLNSSAANPAEPGGCCVPGSVRRLLGGAVLVTVGCGVCMQVT